MRAAPSARTVKSLQPSSRALAAIGEEGGRHRRAGLRALEVAAACEVAHVGRCRRAGCASRRCRRCVLDEPAGRVDRRVATRRPGAAMPSACRAWRRSAVGRARASTAVGRACRAAAARPRPARAARAGRRTRCPRPSRSASPRPRQCRRRAVEQLASVDAQRRWRADGGHCAPALRVEVAEQVERDHAPTRPAQRTRPSMRAESAATSEGRTGASAP